MTLFTYPNAFAPVKADGTPNRPDLGQADVLVKELITALQMALFDGRIYSTRAALYADLAHAANSWALVIGDPTSGYDGLYQKSGASGSGSWSRVGDVPGSGFIPGTDSGAGTPNAIQVTSPAIPATDGAALIYFRAFEANTATPVTVSFNGGTALTIKTAAGNDVSVGGIAAGTPMVGVKSGTTFRLISDQASAAVLAACEAAQQAAEDARDLAIAAASSVVSTLETVAYAVSSYHPVTAPDFIEVAGYTTIGDCGRAFLYKASGSEPTHGAKFSITLDDTVTVAWYELAEREATPGMCGAPDFAGSLSDLSTLADSTTALANWAEYINETDAVGVMPSIYKSTAAIEFTRDGVVVSGIGARASGVLFDDCDGFILDIAGDRMPRYKISSLAILTNADRALGYNGLDVTCPSGPGGADTMRVIEENYFGGQRIFETENASGVMSAETTANRKQAWAKAINLTESDNTVIRDNRIHGPIFDWNSSYSGTDISYGIYSDGCTALECVRNKVLFPTYGFRVGGAAEATLMQDNVAGACRGGFLYEAFSGAANWHKCIRNHASAHEFGIKFNEDGATPGLAAYNRFQGNLIFMFPGSAYGHFTHMIIRTNNSKITENHIYVSSGDDPTVASGLVDQGIKLTGTFNLIAYNTFIRNDLCIAIQSGSVSTMVIGNQTQGSFPTSSVPMTDAGTDTTCMFNTGDAKAELWPAVIYDGEKAIDIWSHQAVDIYGGAAGSRYRKASFPNVAGSPVNYLEVVPSATGSPVFIRAAGSDTDIDLRLISKGAGHVRFGTRVASSDVAVTGYIEIKDSGGTVRRLAVVG